MTDLTEIFSGSPRRRGDIKAAVSTRALWLELLEVHGLEQAAANVDGDFAMATLRPDGSVFMAVDRFAIRTLCYRIDPQGIRVAERADSLRDDSGALEPQAVFEYLYHHVIPSPDTIHVGVQRLPGHCAVFRDGQLTVSVTGRQDSNRANSRLTKARRQLRSVLQDAVARQLDGTKPACFLSGGTDSSTVAGLMAELSDQKVTAYSIGFEADGYDEMDYARLAAKHFGCEHREIYFTPEVLVQEIPKVAASFDQPFGNSSVLPSYHCAHLAKADGVSRILAGDGGDELFGGNSRYATQRLFDHWQRLPASLRDGVIGPLFSLPLMAKLPLLRKGASYVRQASIPMPDRIQDYNLIQRIGYEQLFTPEFLAQVRQSDIDEAQRSVWAEADAHNELDRHLAFDWRFTLAECDLPKVVGSTHLAGVAVGFPMLDEALVAFSSAAATVFQGTGKTLRWFYKEALRGFLPDEVISKKKQGFGLPFGVWMVQHDALNALTRDSLQGLVPRGLLRGDFVRHFFSDLLPSHPHYYGTMAWILMMLEQWLRAHAPEWEIATR